MRSRNRPTAPGNRAGGPKQPSAPKSRAEAILQLARAFGPRRLALALLVTVGGIWFGWSGEYSPEAAELEAARRAAEARAKPPAPMAGSPAGTAALRLTLARLPGTGISGVYKLLSRRGLLGDVPPEKVAAFVEEVRAALVDAEPAQRLGAARVLATLRSSAGVSDLIALSGDEEAEVRHTALRGLGRMRGDGIADARQRLQAVSGDASFGRPDRFHAIQSLSRLSEPVDTDLVASVAAREPDPVLRLMAARTLLAHRDRRAVPVLLDLLEAGSGSPEDLAFVRREANDTLRAVTPAEPEEETRSGWTSVAPRIEGAMRSSEFSYTPRPLRLQVAE